MGSPRIQRLRLGLCLTGLLCGCDPGEVAQPTSPTQKVVLDVSRVSALSQADIQRVQLMVNGPGIDVPIVTDLGRSGPNAWTAVVPGIPAGPARTFLASAYDSNGAVIYQGAAMSDVLSGSTLELVLVLQDPVPPPQASTPTVGSVEASQGRVPPSTPVDLRITATPAPGDSLTFSWTAQCPGTSDAGSFSSVSGSSTSWTAPAVQPVTCLLSVRVAGTAGSSVTVYLSIQVSS